MLPFSSLERSDQASLCVVRPCVVSDPCQVVRGGIDTRLNIIRISFCSCQETRIPNLHLGEKGFLFEKLWPQKVRPLPGV